MASFDPVQKVEFCGECHSQLKRAFYKCSLCQNVLLCPSCMDMYESQQDDGVSHKLVTHPLQDHLFLRLTVDNYGGSQRGLHPGIKCVHCPPNSQDIAGYRYFCTTCAVSLCESCELLGCHRLDHNLLKMAPPSLVRMSKVASEMSGRLNDVGSTTSESSAEAALETFDNDNDIIPSTRISFNTLKAMLRRENDLRLSPAIQQQYRERGYDAYVDITEALQRQVAEEFHLEMTEGVDYLQTAEMLVRPNQARMAEVRSLSLYRKYNRCFDGAVQVGDVAPLLPHPLYIVGPDSDDQQQQLPKGVHYSTFVNDYLTKTVGGLLTPEMLRRPLVLVCGSYS